MKTKITLMVLTATLLNACSFDSLFLQPTRLPKFPSNRDKVTLTSTSKYASSPVDFNTKTLQPTFLTKNKDTIKMDYTIESVLFKSSNGNDLNGWMLKPKNKKVATTLLHFHGNAGFILSQYQTMTPLLKYGLQIFVFDYSGFGFSKGKATRDNVLLDGNASLTYLKSREDVKNTLLVIYGQSLGGNLASVVATQRQAEIDGLVLEGAFSSHKDIAANSVGILGRMIVSEKYSSYKAIQEFKKPVLIIHSTEDKTVPFELGQKIYDHANPPKELYKIKNCHTCGPAFYADNIASKIMSMLK